MTADCNESLFAISNAHGCTAVLSSLGACLRSLNVPSASGKSLDVVLGLADEQAYAHDELFMGVTAGRYSGRIAGGKLSLHGATRQLACNDHSNHIHGGAGGLHSRHWYAVPLSRRQLQFFYYSPQDEEGYPGNLRVSVVYQLHEHNALQIDYRADCDAETVINLTNHSYFNLNGHASGDVLNHELQILSGHIAELDRQCIPTGQFLAVAGLPFDFREPRCIGDRINMPHPQLHLAGGFDHGWIFKGGGQQLEHPMARLYAPASGIALEVFSDQTSLQFYSGNNLPQRWNGKDAAIYGQRQGLCLETQHLPNSPNESRFPSTRLMPGETYASSTVFSFSTGRPAAWR